MRPSIYRFPRPFENDSLAITRIYENKRYSTNIQKDNDHATLPRRPRCPILLPAPPFASRPLCPPCADFVVTTRKVSLTFLYRFVVPLSPSSCPGNCFVLLCNQHGAARGGKPASRREFPIYFFLRMSKIRKTRFEPKKSSSDNFFKGRQSRRAFLCGLG